MVYICRGELFNDINYYIVWMNKLLKIMNIKRGKVLPFTIEVMSKFVCIYHVC